MGVASVVMLVIIVALVISAAWLLWRHPPSRADAERARQDAKVRDELRISDSRQMGRNGRL